jgi:hypothetical protein
VTSLFVIPYPSIFAYSFPDRFIFLAFHEKVTDEGENYTPRSCSLNVVIKSRIRWAGHVTRMGEKRNAFRFLKEIYPHADEGMR